MNDEKKLVKKYKFKVLLSIFLNITIITILGIFAWMMTSVTSTENIDYTGNLVVPDNDIVVKLFVLKDNEFVEQLQDPTKPLIQLGTLEPGSAQKYRFDIYNNRTNIDSITKIVFSEIYGDIDLLKNVVQIRCTSPSLFIFKLEDRIEYDEINEHHFFDFIDKLRIPKGEMLSVYFNIYIDKNATNAIQNTNLSINKIMFISP